MNQNMKIKINCNEEDGDASDIKSNGPKGDFDGN